MATRNVVHTIRHPDGAPWAGACVVFRLVNGGYTGAATYPADALYVSAGADGALVATLWINVESAVAARWRCTLPDGETFDFDVPAGDGAPVALSALRAAEPYVPATSLAMLLDDYYTEAETDALLAAVVAGVVIPDDVVRSDDPRLSDARAPTAHDHDGRYYTEAETDALLAALLADVAPSDDPRLSDARAPTAHATTHATGQPDALSAADIGAATAGDLTTHAGLTTAAHGGIVAATDARLTDARAPLAHHATHATGQADALAPADIGAALASDLTTHVGLTTAAHGGIVAATDARLSNARTPTAHKATHATGQPDALAPADIGAAAASHSHANDAWATRVQAVQALSDGAGSIAWDMAAGHTATLTIGGARTLANPTNLVNGASYVLRVTQDGVGGRTLAYGNAYKWTGGAAPVLSTAAGAVDVLTFVATGTVLYGAILKGFA
jgi:hypothetical protein